MEPQDVVLAFIAEMNKWEKDSDFSSRRQRKGEITIDEEFAIKRTTLIEIFKKYVANWEKKERIRSLSHAKPPEYDSDKQKFISVTVEGSKALVVTHYLEGTTKIFDTFRLVLEKGEWRISTRKHRWLFVHCQTKEEVDEENNRRL